MPYPILRWTVFPLFRFFFGTVEGLANLPPRGPYIIAANHVGSADYFFIVAMIIRSVRGRIHFFARSEKWRDYIGRRFWDCIIIDPANKDASLREAEQCLERREVCAIFPEGQPSKNSPQLFQGKTGAARLALATGVPVVPIGFLGPWAGESFLATVRNYFHYTKKVEIRVGQPLVFPKVQSEQVTPIMLEEKTRVIMSSIARLCRKKYPY